MATGSAAGGTPWDVADGRYVRLDVADTPARESSDEITWAPRTAHPRPADRLLSVGDRLVAISGSRTSITPPPP